MVWMRRLLLVLVLMVVAVVAAAFAIALRAPAPTGFQVVGVTAADGHRFPVGLWYPTTSRTWPTTLVGLVLMDVARDAPVEGRGLPLVVISHGTGGGLASHADLAMALAARGFVVAAPMHAGDNYADGRALATADWLAGRTREVRDTVDHLLARWPDHARLDADRIGMFGFSAGGFTTLVEVGGTPDLRGIAGHCASTPEFACRLLAESHSPLARPDGVPPASAYAHDPRIRAAVVAAPGLGFLFGQEATAGIAVPVQVWTGTADESVPTASNARIVVDALGSRAELRELPGAGHFAFLVPCPPVGPPMLCKDGPGFDRRAAHARMNDEVARFFEARMTGRR